MDGKQKGRGRGRGRGKAAGKDVQQSATVGQQHQQEERQQSSIAEALPMAAMSLLPRESKALKPIHRPGLGTKGRRIQLYANFYWMQFEDINIHHYDLEIEGDPRDRAFKRELVTTMMFENLKIFGHIYHAFDGNKNLYSAGPLNLSHGQHSFKVLLPGRTKAVEIKIQHVGGDGGIVNLSELSAFINRKTPLLSPEVLNVLDIILQQNPSKNHFGIGKYFFAAQEDGHINWGPGLQQCAGFYSSVRPTWKYMFAQIDTSIRIFHKEQTLLEFICEALNFRNPQQLTEDDIYYARDIINEKLDALSIQVTHLKYVRTFRAIKLTRQTCRQLKFKLEQEGKRPREVSVAQYFHETYPNSPLRFPHLPCVQVQPEALNRYFPIEICKVKKGQQYTKMSDKQKTDLIRASAIPARDRKDKIDHLVQQRAFNSDPFAQKFGLKVSPKMKQLEGRVLDAPTIQYGTQSVIPRDGAWKQTSPYHISGTIKSIIIITFAMSTKHPGLESFFKSLQRIGKEQGICIPDPLHVLECKDPRRIGDMLTYYRNQTPDLNLVLVVLSNFDTYKNTEMYNALKMACDVTLGISSQAVVGKNVMEKKYQTLLNICLKINAKVGGVNNVINKTSRLTNSDQFLNIITRRPMMVFGADVTHPSPQNKQDPSIAAVVGSYDRPLTKYAAIIGVQDHREEIIVNMQQHVYKLLMTFYQKNFQRKPEKIIFYRDGVGEGQFDQVLLREMASIQRACLQLENGYKPAITLIVVQKRHHTRLFPVNRQDESGRAGNIPPGTTVDTDIVHPIEFDFYLNSHQGIQGTCKPAHYHVLWDDNNMTADDLQEMTFQLCHLYARCNRSVSIPAPAYYAHLLAFRARAYLDTMQTGGQLPEDPTLVQRVLQDMNNACQPHERVAPGMFFV